MNAHNTEPTDDELWADVEALHPGAAGDICADLHRIALEIQTADGERTRYYGDHMTTQFTESNVYDERVIETHENFTIDALPEPPRWRPFTAADREAREQARAAKVEEVLGPYWAEEEALGFPISEQQKNNQRKLLALGPLAVTRHTRAKGPARVIRTPVTPPNPKKK